MKGYAVAEIFWSIQGEGCWSGTPAAFVRFAGCNLWNGQDEDRERDAARHGVDCPRWCDTDFRVKMPHTADEIVDAIWRVVPKGATPPLIVLTGGEPLLQLDDELLGKLDRCFHGTMLALETNGTVELPDSIRGWLDWVCVSPKTPPDKLKVREGDELKVIYPGFNPADYEHMCKSFGDNLIISPLALTTAVGQSYPQNGAMEVAARYCMEHPRWRLTLQLHKLLGLR